ncbi:VirB10/TraB/TrbI family type IV secretion system protein [Pectobacterium versatile]|uniref:VirB10/TraB/TrbI family type IV secretion system protein n=1 Tax=Pectobacterium versatile TaxID=2488639 RepID=UPI000DAB34CF|nr:VirB10/TraB/TrbI family type IV secretion system protein [Pectobacterium versatile]GBO48478.1 type IV secretion system protein virB10 [Pectobacterium versatile]
MTDTPSTDTGKTTAEREAEARTRLRAERNPHTQAQRHDPNQPEVARFRKPSGHRTLIVILLSLALSIALSLGGSRFFGTLKTGGKKEAGSTPPSGIASAHARRGLGMDSNPFGQQTPPSVTASANQSAATLPPELPRLNKAAALADSAGTTTAPSERSSTVPSVTLVKGKEEQPYPNEQDASPPDSTHSSATLASITHVRRLGLDPDLYIPVDRYIPCSMMRRFVSEVGGRISCLIGEDVYSASNHVRLIPAGTLARGIYRTGALQHGRSRMFVIWTELRTPEPGSLQIPLTDTEVTGQLGEAGIAGRIDSHFWQRFGNALMLSTVQDVAAAAAGAAPGKDRHTDYTENTRAATAEMAKITLENSISIPPTLYLNQGDIIGIMTGADIDFSSIYQLRLKARGYGR